MLGITRGGLEEEKSIIYSKSGFDDASLWSEL